MDDYIPAPDVVHIVRQGDFKLYVYAYRTLAREELLMCAGQWLEQFHRKKFPKKGSGKLISNLGLAD